MTNEQELLARMESCDAMARSLCSRYAAIERRSVESSEAYADARYHLLMAAMGYDPSYGVKFVTYAHRSVRRGLLRDYRSRRGLSRYGSGMMRVHQIVDSQEETLLVHTIDEFINQDQFSHDKQKVMEALQYVGDRNQEVIRRRIAGEGYKEIGESLGVSKQRAEQITKDTFREIRVRCGLRENGREAG